MLYKFEKPKVSLAHGIRALKSDRLWLFYALAGVAFFYLSLIWKASSNIDHITTDLAFWSAILWLLWKKKDRLRHYYDPYSSFIGLLFLTVVLSRTLFLFEFEAIFLSFVPVCAMLPILLIASGFRGLSQYGRELFFTLLLFFPTGALGFFLDDIFQITILNAKVATYFLYYIGFNTTSQGNQVILSLPELGTFKAIVNFSCAGIPMILLMLKLALIFISCISLSKKQQVLIPAFSLGLGFLLGVIRVCLLTLLIPNRVQFDYWHGNQGSQIFSTAAIIIFSGFCYWILEKNQQPVVSD